MRKLEVLGIQVDSPSISPVLVLKDSQTDKCIPIWIGASEATIITSILEGLVSSRPLTHDLMNEVLAKLDHKILSVNICEVEDNIFYAEINIDGKIFSARPSDAVILALKNSVTITCSDELFDAVSVELETSNYDEMAKFREFLDKVAPEDFDA